MKVVVLGGTGVLGRLVVERLRARGHEVAAPARAEVDAETGAGLRESVRGADAVVDCVNIRTASGKRSVAGFGAVAQHVSEAVLAEQVPHLVVVTIFGVHGERMQRRNGYYRGKAHQERVLAALGAPVTLVRSPQWFEIAETFLKGRIGPLAIVPHMRSQPVAAVEVADAMAIPGDAATRGSSSPSESPARTACSSRASCCPAPTCRRRARPSRTGSPSVPLDRPRPDPPLAVPLHCSRPTRGSTLS